MFSVQGMYVSLFFQISQWIYVNDYYQYFIRKQLEWSSSCKLVYSLQSAHFVRFYHSSPYYLLSVNQKLIPTEHWMVIIWVDHFLQPGLPSAICEYCMLFFNINWSTKTNAWMPTDIYNSTNSLAHFPPLGLLCSICNICTFLCFYEFSHFLIYSITRDARSNQLSGGLPVTWSSLTNLRYLYEFISFFKFIINTCMQDIWAIISWLDRFPQLGHHSPIWFVDCFFIPIQWIPYPLMVLQIFERKSINWRTSCLLVYFHCLANSVCSFFSFFCQIWLKCPFPQTFVR